MENVSVAIVDDHKLFRSGIGQLIGQFHGYTVISLSGHGKEFIESVNSGLIPDIAILDIQMPQMDGEETAQWIKKNQPQIKVLALTMYDDERNILRMIKAGARGYLLKNAEPDELKIALDQIRMLSFYHSELISKTLMKNFIIGDAGIKGTPFNLTEKEIEFLHFACSELTYKEISDQMQVSIRSVDGFRESLTAKFNVKSRVGLVLFAIKNDLVKL